MKHIPDQILVFDVESVGLHGQAFAVGGVVLDTRSGTTSQDFAFHVNFADINSYATHPEDDRKWVEENVTIHPKSVDAINIYNLYEVFWALWKNIKSTAGITGKSIAMAADCAWPVEAKFLLECVNRDKRTRNWEGPYPLHDIASFLTAAGLDPMHEFPRQENELPKHEALADARQSARLLFTAINLLRMQHDDHSQALG